MEIQAALICEICENDRKLKWKCIECGRFMCQRCRDVVHPKWPSAQDHTVVDIKDVGRKSKSTGTEPHKLDLNKLKCSKHSGQNSCLFCNSCCKLVCATCVAKTHKKHDLLEISEGYKNRIDSIQNEQKTIEKKIKILNTTTKKLDERKTCEHSTYEKVKQDVLNFDRVLVEQVKQRTNQIVAELDQSLRTFTELVAKEEKEAKRKERTLKEKRDELVRLTGTRNAQEVFSFSDSFEPFFEVNVKTSFQHVPKFCPGDLSNIVHAHGRLESSLSKDIKLQVVTQFTIDTEAVNDLVSCPDGSFWVYNDESRQVQKAVPDGNTLKVMSKVKLDMIDMSSFSNGEILASILGSSNLVYIQPDKQKVQNSNFSVSPLATLAVHVTRDEKVIVGAADKGDWFPIQGPRQLIVMDQTGRWRKLFEVDSKNKPLFNVPVRVTTSSDSNIAVIDVISEDLLGRIIVLDEGGKIVNIYTGNPEINNEHCLFRPMDIVTSQSDSFVIAESYNYFLHILNSKGNLMLYLDTKKVGIDQQKSLAVDYNGHFYIGVKCKQKAKIFFLKNF
ncbi:TRIM33 [Mytilus coruscus]|uniref:TRIM33 n=1 Tax=Mytilus coruscus TaxID=42192 RepID=A0A6J8BCY4_MYTCO|nr:TRIM33 [Mytilus coruscus]